MLLPFLAVASDLACFYTCPSWALRQAGRDRHAKASVAPNAHTLRQARCTALGSMDVETCMHHHNILRVFERNMIRNASRLRYVPERPSIVGYQILTSSFMCSEGQYILRFVLIMTRSKSVWGLKLNLQAQTCGVVMQFLVLAMSLHAHGPCQNSLLASVLVLFQSINSSLAALPAAI